MDELGNDDAVGSPGAAGVFALGVAIVLAGVSVATHGAAGAAGALLLSTGDGWPPGSPASAPVLLVSTILGGGSIWDWARPVVRRGPRSFGP